MLPCTYTFVACRSGAAALLDWFEIHLARLGPFLNHASYLISYPRNLPLDHSAVSPKAKVTYKLGWDDTSKHLSRLGESFLRDSFNIRRVTKSYYRLQSNPVNTPGQNTRSFIRQKGKICLITGQSVILRVTVHAELTN